MKKPGSLLLYIFILIFSATAQGVENAKLDSYVEALAKHDKAMLSLAIVENGTLIYHKSTGVKDLETKQPANEATQYRIGSITKMFTSVMIFQLIEESKLSLDTTLDQFYPNIENADKITVSMLLSHRSGIPNFTDSPQYSQYMTQSHTEAEMINKIKKLDSEFLPGSKAKYSNSGYVLLGFILENVTNDSYASQLEKRISNKLGLKRTAYGGPINVQDNQANSYVRAGFDWSPASQTDMSIPHGAGAIISTPADVSMFLSGLFSGKLISAPSLSKMKEINQGFGRGLFQYRFNDRTAYGHDGGIDGFSSQAAYFEADKVAISLTSNAMNYSINEIGIAILSIYFDLPYDIPDFNDKPVSLPQEKLVNYEGVYSSPQIPLKISLKVNDGRLMAQASGQGAFPLTPYSDSKFHFDAAGIVLIFKTNDGEVDHSVFELNQAGGKYIFSRE
ncbi:beta-lactamase family protein [Salinimonas sp. HHU 13199]|uniref:Beta-lactamase family protein n=1 Tax=Salinimonas profundi TaxID=2729140 RepID=A0ABR8LHI8_9ALTE|nr:serine hydrolase domain-containing protein [Salinimonas profundi]MBD3585721.1 beta-lactamase family protein [Salinimonas profundi]